LHELWSWKRGSASEGGWGFSLDHYYTLHSAVVLAKQTSLVGKVATVWPLSEFRTSALAELSSMSSAQFACNVLCVAYTKTVF
jgi:hypothetical protein